MFQQIVAIRTFQPQDFQQVMEIEREAFNEHNPYLYMQFYESNADTFLVATKGENILGFVVGLKIEGIGKIFSIAVHKNHRRTGIGRMLLNAITLTFQNKRIKEIYLEVRESNYPALRFYEKHGFMPIMIQPAYYIDGENAIIMKKNLLPSI
jgi:ribosomal-protein-alanine N-acetyltransferase